VDFVDFKNNVFVLPCMSVGNVGQLAIDLIVNTLELPRVGFLDSAYVLPVIGNDAFSNHSGKLTLNLEVFQDTRKGITLLQQRAPAIRGRHNAFATTLVTWILKSGFSSVIMLHSIEAGMRFVEQQLYGSQFRYIHTEPFNNTMIKQLPWTVLESGADVELFSKGSVSDKIFMYSKQAGLPTLVFILFCTEGNNVPEGTLMADHLDQYLSLKSPVGTGQKEIIWKAPDSWSLLFSTGTFDQNLFM